MRRPTLHWISRPAELSALRSPVRQELLDVLARVDAVSLAEAGALLGRPSDALYYHVRILERAGLVRAAGRRMVNGRPEALYRAAASQFAVRYAPAPARQAAAVNGIVAAMLRLNARDFRRALGQEGLRLEGPSRDLWALRTTGWMRPADLRRVNRVFRRLAERSVRARPPGRLYAISALLAPLDHRTHTTGRRPRRRNRT
jgi:predicted transcriptional regulator